MSRPIICSGVVTGGPEEPFKIFAVEKLLENFLVGNFVCPKMQNVMLKHWKH